MSGLENQNEFLQIKAFREEQLVVFHFTGKMDTVKSTELSSVVSDALNGLFIDDAIRHIKYKYKNYHIQIIKYNSCITCDWDENRIRIMLGEDGLTAIYTSIG